MMDKSNNMAVKQDCTEGVQEIIARLQQKPADWKWIVVVNQNEEVLWMNDALRTKAERKKTATKETAKGRRNLQDIFCTEIIKAIHQCKVKESYTYVRDADNYMVCSLIDVDIDEGETEIRAIGINMMVTIEDMAREIRRINKMNYELRKALDSSFDGIYITDCQGITLMINEAHERISGINKARLLNRKINKMVEKGVFSGFITSTVVKEHRPITMLQEVVDTQKNLLITGNPVYNEKGEMVKVVTNVRDVTELINLQKELKATKAIVEQYRDELFDTTNLQRVVVEEGSKFESVLHLAKKVASKDSTVLILGETGVGKEVVARYIFSNSGRNEKNYLKINCGAIPENLLESELFGYVKGAFTGADVNGKMGMFEMANNGTLFLDEIGELPLHLQASLLRVLQDGEITRIGETKNRKVNVRIIAATNRDLNAMMREGRFRSDLYYRLNVVSITVPPLRERKGEIPGLVEQTIRRLNEKYHEKKVVTTEFIDTLLDREWRGNIRELENYVERCFVIQDDDIIDAPYANRKPEEIRNSVEVLEVDKLMTMQEAIEKVEREQMKKAMKIGKSSYKAAELLGMSQSTFFRKYRKLVVDAGPEGTE